MSPILFLDWINVNKGRMHVSLDPDRITDEGRRIIERNRRVWKMEPDLSGHALKRVRVPAGVRITIEQARKSGPWLTQDRPWEKRIYWITVIHEDDKYRGWYAVELAPSRDSGADVEQVFQQDRKVDVGRNGLCYAESDDGMNWTKPELGMIEFDGSTANNIVSRLDMACTAIFRDESAPPEERYKAFAWDRLSDTPDGTDFGLFGAFSPDGYHWTRTSEPLLPYFHDTQNIACWDAERRKYLGYFRHHLGGRAISYAETDDFRKWPATEVIEHAGPLDDPDIDYYTNGFVRYPGLSSVKLLFPAMFHHGTEQLDVRLAVTHNGRAIKWVSHHAIIEVGAPGEWDCGRVYACPELVRLPDGTLAVPYLGVNATHCESTYVQLYRDYHFRSGHGWAIWDDGRLAGIEAVDRGEFWTNPASCNGQPIEINARTSQDGSVEVELCDGAGPIPGYTFEDAVPFRGDEIWIPLRWRGKADLSELRGKTVSLHVRLSRAKIFGYRMLSDPGTVTTWNVSELVAKGPDVTQAPCRGLDAPLRWTRLEAGADGLANIHERVGVADGIVYFANRFRVSQRGRWTMQVGHDGGVQVFLDGQSVLLEPERKNPARPGRSQVEVDLERGEHEVVIALDTAGGFGWGIYFSWAIPTGEQTGDAPPVFPSLSL